MRDSMPVPVGVRRVRLPALLASSSVAALLMGGGGPAFAACTDYINTTAAGCTNAGTISHLTVSNSTVNGQINNTGTIAPNGITIQNGSVINGVIQSSGPIAGGVSIDQTSSIVAPGQGVSVFGPSFSGDMNNAGTLTINGGGGNSGFLAESTSFTGNIVNTGTMNIGTTAAGSNGVGIQVDNSNDLTTFTGGITNGGAITVKATNSFGSCTAYGIAVLGNMNSIAPGTPITSFTGGITNGGTINVTMSGTAANVSTGIVVTDVTTFMGGITNTATGNINAQATGAGSSDNGIFVNNVTSFQGGITNLGSISAGGVGIQVMNSGPVSVFDSGSIVSAGGVAVDLSHNAAGNTFTLGPGFSITGRVLGQGADTFQLGGSGTGSFDLDSIGSTKQYRGFTSFNVVGGTWISSNTFGQTQTWNVNGGTLAGTGTFRSLNVNNGGALLPGQPGVAGGKLSVNGDLTFSSGSNYIVNISPATSSITAVTGKANLTGTLTLIPTGGQYTAGKVYDILSATGGLNGTFSTVQIDGSFGNLKAVVTYDDVFVTLVANLLTLPPGTPVNPTNVGNAVNNANTNGSTLPPGLVNLFNLTPTQLVPALTALDGEVATGARRGAFLLNDQFLELMLDPFVDGRSGSGWGLSGGTISAMGYAPEKRASLPAGATRAYAKAFKAPPAQTFDQRWSVWGAAFGGSATAKGDPVFIGSSNVTANDYAFAGGADYRLTPDSVVGFALAGGGTNWGLSGGLGTGRSDMFEGGVYGTTRWGNAYFGADAEFGNHWMSTQRFALGDQLTANFNGQIYGVRAETGYRYAVIPAVGITPYAALQSQWFHTPNYSETDLTNPLNGFALSYAGTTANDTKSELGARFDGHTMIGNTPLVLRARLAWAHDWVSMPAMSAAFTALPASPFTVYGAPLPRDSVLTSLAAEAHLTTNWTATAKFYGDFANGYQSYAGTGTLRYTW
jgi:uncharacterized protein with beta-barrel porin domain